MINERSVAAHYDTTDLYKRIEFGLLELNLSLDAITTEQLGIVDNFHIGGRGATRFIAEYLQLNEKKVALDIGCGIGGPARYISELSGCYINGIDLTRSFVETGQQLNVLAKLDDKVSFIQGSALNLPYASLSFDCAYMIHVGMNIENKDQLMSETYRVLKHTGRFVVFDVMKCTENEIQYPLPWADKRQDCALDKTSSYTSALTQAGFKILAEEDRSEFATAFFEDIIPKVKQGGPKPLGLHLLMGSNTKEKIRNIYTQIRDGSLSPKLIVSMKKPSRQHG